MLKLLAGLTLVPALAYAAQPAQMTVVCGPTSEVLQMLKDYKEKTQLVGKEDDDVVVSVWTNEQTGTFTVIKTRKDGKVSCVISAGTLLPKA